jgi:hypothetical protein
LGGPLEVRYNLDMSRLVAILLSFVIWACPLVCAVGKCSAHAAGNSKACGSCCDREAGDDAPAKNSHDSKSPTSPGPSHGSQCICNGAVMGDAAWTGVELDARWDLPAVMPVVVATSVALPDGVVREAWLPDIGLSAGRALCCLHSVLQC